MYQAVLFDMYETLITHYASPLYFDTQMAADAGVPFSDFHAAWFATMGERTVGRMTLEEALRRTLTQCGCYTEALCAQLASRRIAAKAECFRHLHPEILPMLTALKENGLPLGLVSNCFEEEGELIEKSILFPYFDVACLSWREGVAKPDPEIFLRCVRRLGVAPSACLYVGDGGSEELEAAAALGMRSVQAVWYLREGTTQPAGRKQGFLRLENPMALLQLLHDAP